MTTDTEKAELTDLDSWRICDELTVVQAALLIAGHDPSIEQFHVEGWEPQNRPKRYEAAKAAVSAALRRGMIKGEVVPRYDHDIHGPGPPIEGSIDLGLSTVEVSSLRSWLEGRGVRSGFFFAVASDAPEYLDKTNPRYAPKLAAAVRAWRAVTDPRGKPPKQALMKWLRENAAALGLTDEDGVLNETGIEEVAKVANWQPGGGAPKTPVE